MPEIVECPSCRRQLKVPETLINQRVKCPSCGTPFEALPSVSAEAGVSAAESPPPPPPPLPEVAPPVPRTSSAGSPAQRPGKVQAIAIMTLVGGILAVFNFLVVGGSFGVSTFGLCCLWPGFYYGLVIGIMAIVKGSALMSVNAAAEVPPKTIAILQIINIINFDVPNCVMGILTLVFLGDPEVEGFFKQAKR